MTYQKVTKIWQNESRNRLSTLVPKILTPLFFSMNGLLGAIATLMLTPLMFRLRSLRSISTKLY